MVVGLLEATPGRVLVRNGMFQPALPWNDRYPSEETFDCLGYHRASGYLPALGEEVVPADTCLYLSPEHKTQNPDMCCLFCQMLADVYQSGWYLLFQARNMSDLALLGNPDAVFLEDVHVGWCTDDEWYKPNPKNGVVGQEIYSAGGPLSYDVWEYEDQRE